MDKKDNKNNPELLGDILKNVNKQSIQDNAEIERQKAYDISRIFQQMELDLISSMKRAFSFHQIEQEKEGFVWEQWQLSKLRAMEEFRKRNRAIVDSYSEPIQQAIDRELNNNFEAGEKRAEKLVQKIEEAGVILPKSERSKEELTDILETPKLEEKPNQPQEPQLEAPKHQENKPFNPAKTPPPEQNFFGVNDKKIEALQKSVEHDLKEAQHSVLRKMDDIYRQTLFKTHVYLQNGAKTLEQAIDMATKDFLEKGIDSIVYKNGRRVNIASYAEMALRTASQRATFLGEGKKRDEWGLYLVVVSAHANTCKMCEPWQGKVLIDDVFSHPSKEFIQENSKYHLLSEAIAAGLLHPNCRHTLITYFPGITQLPTVPDGKDAVKTYEAEQKQRYIERQIRMWKRIVVGSTDSENVSKADAKVKEWQKKLKQHLEDNSQLRRNNAREEVKGYKPIKITGALNPESKEAEKHAMQYYESVRHMKTDVGKIAKNTGFSEKTIQLIKNHIFTEEHNLGYGLIGRFDPDYDMARSWQRLIEGKEIKAMDIIMLRHEYLESGLMKRYNYEYRVAHDITERKYNYSKAVKEERGGS
ncbi:phage minor capsid protein [Candidatus Clostridium stratigraminis]|uniref:Phage minor capsid protein n=1 Tax=Candidatus Clostridium stratigraminis TaxID=3381661 RepID=A0ABW8SZ22_9CLOT